MSLCPTCSGDRGRYIGDGEKWGGWPYGGWQGCPTCYGLGDVPDSLDEAGLRKGPTPAELDAQERDGS